ncbi:unnamed protein product [Allacma fusca]|uniref:Uncharacterized protein n=1 Tax=Allacma fusca TaxID=39272 RepID=A0A8J2KGX4_9HEXA|nr:unnamed protein product [Allacma fusca]
MDNCSSLMCCSECTVNCIWGKAYRSTAVCVDSAVKLGRFIFVEVHPGQSCSIPGLEQGACALVTEKPVSPESSSLSWYTGVIIALGILLLIICLGYLFYWKKMRRPSPPVVIGMDNQNYGSSAVIPEEVIPELNYSEEPSSPITLEMRSFADDRRTHCLMFKGMKTDLFMLLTTWFYGMSKNPHIPQSQL